MSIVEKFILVLAALLLSFITLWVQMSGNEEEGMVKARPKSDAVDYYVTNFTTTSLNADGEVTHIVEGAKLTHYSHEDTALIDTPRVIEFKKDGTVQNTYAQTGFIGPAGNTIELLFEVKIFEQKKAAPNATEKPVANQILATDRLFITLKETATEEAKEN